MKLSFLSRANKTDPAPQPETRASAGPSHEVVEKYLSQVRQFTSLLPAIAQGANQLSLQEKEHLQIIQDFNQELNLIFQKQEAMSSSSNMVLETSWEYKQVILNTQQKLENLLASFDQALAMNNQVQEAVQQLGNGIGQMSQVIRLLTDLATNIRQLSRNAEIMSYHAGEQGRGFSVIVEKMSLLTDELEQAASRTPRVDAEIRARLESIIRTVEAIRKVAMGLRANTEEVRKKLGQIFELNQRIIQGFESIQQASENQKAVEEKLLKGMTDISGLAETLGVSQEVVATMLATEMADAGQIDFIREELETARRLEAAGRADWAGRQVAKQLLLLRNELEPARSRWLELNQSIAKLRQTVQEQERVPTQLLQELEGLFEGIEQIGAKLSLIDKDLTLTQQGSVEIEGKLSRADQDLKQWQAGLAEVKATGQGMADYLSQLNQIGETVKAFAEQIKLLAFYSAVEAADMGQTGSELKPLVNQARDLANQANADSLKLFPILGRIGEIFRETVKLVDSNLEILDRILGDVSQAKWSLAKLKESAEQFELIGSETAKLIEEQRQKRQDLAKVYTAFADSFQKVNLKLEEMFRSLSRAAEGLSMFGSFEVQLFDRLDRRSLQAEAEGNLRLPLSSDPLTLDPAMSTDSTSNEVVSQIFEGLVQFDKGANVIPGIAWNWNISADGLTWTFHLRRGVKFHNGRELTAHDVKYSLERLLRKDVKSPNAYFVDMIQGAEECQQGRSQTLSGIKVLDPYCLVITLRSPYMPFLANLAAAATSIVPKEEAERSDFGKQPCGSGPFRFHEWRPGQDIVLEAFREYHQPVSLGQVSFRIGLSEEERRKWFKEERLDQVDIHQREMEDYVKLGKKVQQVASLNVQYICINVSQPTPFAHKLVRQALNYAIDRQAMIDNTELRGEATLAKGIFPPSLAAYNPELKGYPYDPEMAKKLLADAGFPVGLPGEYLLDIRDIKAQMERAELVRQQCLEVGINLKINPLSWKDLLDRAYGGESLLSFRGWSSDNGDPDNFLYPLFHSRNWGRSGNTAFFKSPLIDQMLDRALAMRNPIERLAYYREIEKLIVEEAPWVFLYHSIRFTATQPWLHGYRTRPMGAPRLKDCWLEPHEEDRAL